MLSNMKKYLNKPYLWNTSLIIQQKKNVGNIEIFRFSNAGIITSYQI